MNKLIPLAFISLLALMGCNKQDFTPAAQEEHTEASQEVASYNWVPGEAYVKFLPNATPSTTLLETTLRSSLRSIEDEQALVITPVFNIGGPYEVAQRRHGLDRWYKVSFSKDQDVNEVIEVLSQQKEIEIAHGGVPVKKSDMTITPVSAAQLRTGDDSSIRDYNQGYSAFNTPDPLLKKQWHYQCDGYDGGFYDINFTKGADINLFPAWQEETGKSSVIVAIIDSGVDAQHEDLRESMWSKPDEPGVYGYNFYRENNQIEPDFHGTHVAGTVAARNNNGIGVSGVAGGDGSPDSGVRLMSCQIFNRTGAQEEPGKGDTAGNDGIGKAFQYAAEHGAVIANCSWGFEYDKNHSYNYPTEVPPAIKAGIDYFIKVAGCTPEGNQKASAPMKGGVVFFASGNSGAKNIKIVPSYYDEVIAVGAFDRNMKIADYTNTGEWVDIIAPGGDLPHNANYNWTGILSTITSDFATTPIGGEDFYGNPITGAKYLYPTNHNYAYAQGTSMATPHVSGVAALVVSKFGHNKPGFTNEQLKERILSALKPINHESLNESGLKGKIGRGYLDAVIALEEDKQKAPEAVDASMITSTQDYFSSEMTWEVTKDEDAANRVALQYEIYISETPLKADNLPKEKLKTVVPTADKKEGETLTYSFEQLKDGTTYYVAIVAVDRWGHKSAATLYQFTTTLNHAPVIEGMLETVLIKNTEAYRKMDITLSDKEGHALLHEFTGDSMEGISLVRKGNNITLTIVPLLDAGTYTYTLQVTDELGKSTTKSFTLTVVSYKPPMVVGSVDNVTLTLGEPASTIDLGVLFEVADGFTVTYTAESANPKIVEATISEDGKRLTLTPKGEGITRVTLRVNDGQTSRSTSFEVSVLSSNKEEIYAIYPVPAHSFVKILTKKGIPSISVTVTTARGEILKQEQLLINEQTNEATLHTDRLAPGVYKLHINTGTSVIRRTIVKK